MQGQGFKQTKGFEGVKVEGLKAKRYILEQHVHYCVKTTAAVNKLIV